MADEPENHTLRLIREMREEMRGYRDENLRQHAETRAQRGQMLETVVEMARTVNTTSEAVAKLADGKEKTGRRFNTLEERVAALEEHTGLLKA
jgi:uncharacterized coiled-coil DUF342 family protein